MLRLVIHAATEGHEWVNGPDVAKDHVDVCGLCYHQALAAACGWSCCLNPC